MKFEKILKISGCECASDMFPGGQYTHFVPIDIMEEVKQPLYSPGFMVVMPLNSVKIGQKYKITFESIDD